MLDKNDWEESACPLCMKSDAPVMIPVSRIIDKLDALLSAENYDAACRHLEYWIAEARSLNDAGGELSVTNEMLGLSRRLSDRERGLAAVENCMRLLSAQRDGSVSGAVILVNAATTLKAFGEPARALPLFREAERTLSASLSPDDPTLAALQNNFATALTELGEYDTAADYFSRALEGCVAASRRTDEAVTLVNMAQLAEARGDTIEDIGELLARAENALDAVTERNEDFAFACRKCAPTFGYYGFFISERKLTQLADEYYARA